MYMQAYHSLNSKTKISLERKARAARSVESVKRPKTVIFIWCVHTNLTKLICGLGSANLGGIKVTRIVSERLVW